MNGTINTESMKMGFYMNLSVLDYHKMPEQIMRDFPSSKIAHLLGSYMFMVKLFQIMKINHVIASNIGVLEKNL